MRRNGIALVAGLAALASVQAHAQPVATNAVACPAPPAVENSWPIARPEDAGLDAARLCAMVERLHAIKANIHGVVVVRGGKLVFEQYFTGDDEPWGGAAGQYDFDATTKHDLRSVTKSLISLLVGIAIDRKLIAGIDEPVLRFFPEYAALKTQAWEKITLRHLLAMSSGLDWNENLPWNAKNDEWHLVHDPDPIRYVLERRVALPPDTVWTYNGGCTELLGKIIEKASGLSLDAFAREALFEPLGIGDWEWKTWRGNDKIAAAGGLRMRPRDVAKIGQLVLGKGQWNGRQIVSASWIDESTKPRFQAIGYFGGLFYYGYQWWMGRTLSDGRDVTWIAGMGLGGQRLFIVPDLDLVVMVTQGLYPSPRQGHAALEILYSFVIPAIRDKGAR